MAWARLCRSWVSAERGARGLGERGHADEGGAHQGTTASRCALGRGEDLGKVHGAYAGPLAGQQSADVHQAGVVARDQDLGAGLAHVPGLVGAHGDRGVGVLHREGAAEAAALLGGGQVDEAQAADLLEQPPWPVADAEHPQRVAGRVVGHRVREGGADVGHAEHVDEELGELEDARRRLARRPRPATASPERSATIRCWCRADPAQSRTASRRRRTARRRRRRCAPPAPPRRGSRC